MIMFILGAAVGFVLKSLIAPTPDLDLKIKSYWLALKNKLGNW